MLPDQHPFVVYFVIDGEEVGIGLSVPFSLGVGDEALCFGGCTHKSMSSASYTGT